MSKDMQEYDIFISYANQDRVKAKALADAFQQQGWTVWWDRKIPPGKSFHQVIEEVIAASRCVVVLWSQHSILSEWVLNEADDGRQRGILVPVLLEALKPPLGFRHMHAANLADWQAGVAHAEFDELLESLRQKIGASSAAPGISSATPPPRKLQSVNPVVSERKQKQWPIKTIIVTSGLVIGLYVIKPDRLHINLGDEPVDDAKPAQAVNPIVPQVVATPEKPALPAPGSVFRDTLKDGSKGPEMVVIPAGKFKMGDIQGTGDKSEKPVHEVTIQHAFAVGKYDVTFAEYDAFAQATKRKKTDDKGWGRGSRPVINVSWKDAVDYAEWLSEQTGKSYRLPSEAEWEYVARAGTETDYWWGKAIGKNQANCKGCGSRWDGKQTAPAGSFQSNLYGVYDTVGNVYEWVEDCWNDNYSGAPVDGAAWTSAKCDGHVVRGGSWNNYPHNLRSANRYGLDSDEAYNYLGFRLARDM